MVSVALRSGSAQDVANYLMEHQYGFTTVNDPQGKLATQWDKLLGTKSTVVFGDVFIRKNIFKTHHTKTNIF